MDYLIGSIVTIAIVALVYFNTRARRRSSEIDEYVKFRVKLTEHKHFRENLQAIIAKEAEELLPCNTELESEIATVAMFLGKYCTENCPVGSQVTPEDSRYSALLVCVSSVSSLASFMDLPPEHCGLVAASFLCAELGCPVPSVEGEVQGVIRTYNQLQKNDETSELTQSLCLHALNYVRSLDSSHLEKVIGLHEFLSRKLVAAA